MNIYNNTYYLFVRAKKTYNFEGSMYIKFTQWKFFIDWWTIKETSSTSSLLHDKNNSINLFHVMNFLSLINNYSTSARWRWDDR